MSSKSHRSKVLYMWFISGPNIIDIGVIVETSSVYYKPCIEIYSRSHDDRANDYRSTIEVKTTC